MVGRFKHTFSVLEIYSSSKRIHHKVLTEVRFLYPQQNSRCSRTVNATGKARVPSRPDGGAEVQGLNRGSNPLSVTYDISHICYIFVAKYMKYQIYWTVAQPGRATYE